MGGASASLITGARRHATGGATAAVTTATTGALPAAQRAGRALAGALPDLSPIVEVHGAAVVHISVGGLSRVAAADGDAGGPEGPALAVQGWGSGVIVGADELILTNAHVVQAAQEVEVRLADRREFQARVLGADRRTDAAVLTIEAQELPTAPLGDPRQLRVGEWVLAIGSPFGFENSVTAGVVSAKGRSLPDDNGVPFIQIDAAVHPDNSGGPLFDARDEVVGITSQIFSRTEGCEGLSFAISIDVAVRVKDQIVAHGHARHARLGVVVQEVNQGLADSFGLDRPEGALVVGIEPDGPAARAGLKPCGVLRKLDGQLIVASGDLPAPLGQAQPGAEVRLEVWRQGRRQDIGARLGELDDSRAAADSAASADGSSNAGRLGLALRPLQPRERAATGIDAGLLVERSNGPAGRDGLQPGDLLRAINGTPIASVEQVRGLLARSGKSVAELLQREGERIFVPVRIGWTPEG